MVLTTTFKSLNAKLLTVMSLYGFCIIMETRNGWKLIFPNYTQVTTIFPSCMFIFRHFMRQPVEKASQEIG